MLTSTYTLVALSIEQTTVRVALQSLADELRALPADYATLASSRAAQLCAGLRRVVDNCHWRKLDKFLVPVLRRSSPAASELLDDLEELSLDAAAAMAVAEACIGDGDRPVDRDRFCEAVEDCIAALRSRLEREEHELFPLARGTVGGDAWFAIANQMLAHDAYAHERRVPPRGSVAPSRPRHALPEHEGGARFERDPLQPEFGRRHSTLSIAH
jgi:hemerythrin-like domain-containing protein